MIYECDFFHKFVCEQVELYIPPEKNIIFECSTYESWFIKVLGVDDFRTQLSILIKYKEKNKTYIL